MKKTRKELEAELGKLLISQAEASAGEEKNTDKPAGAEAQPAEGTVQSSEQEMATAEIPIAADTEKSEIQHQIVTEGANDSQAASIQQSTEAAAEDKGKREEEELLPALLEKLPSAIEALLFVIAEPVSSQQLLQTLRKVHPQLNGRTLRQALEKLRDQLKNENRGIRLEEVAGGWQLRTAPEHLPYLRHIVKVNPPRMSRATLETLAVIAYRQPITRGEIEYIRGVDCGAVLRNLLEKKMIRILGRKDEPGRPLIYGTTKEFLSFFSLKDLASLPTLKDFTELSEEARQQLGVGEPASLKESQPAEEEPPQPLDEEQQAAYTPVGNDEIIQELDEALSEIRKRDLFIRREVLPPSSSAPEIDPALSSAENEQPQNRSTTPEEQK